ncbi:uncharacterized protein LOC141708896 isoform X2 [Apium graveolens]
MELAPKFARRLRLSGCNSNEMRVPHAFCMKYGSRIPATLKIIVRTGYEIWLDFDKLNEKFNGLREFYHDFGIICGNTLLFEYVGNFDMKVVILDMHGSEIQYPSIVHPLQERHLSPVSIYDGGWTFVRNLGGGGPVIDSVYVPIEFDDHVGALIPERVEFVVSSGYEFVGQYRRGVNSISDLTGLQSLCNMLHVVDLNCFHLLFFTFDGHRKISVTTIDKTHIENPLSPLPPQSVSAFGDVTGAPAFQFGVKQFHLLWNEHGVDIPVQFRSLCKCWKKTDYISAYVGNRVWLLKIRRRSDRKRTTINDGWRMFREDLKLDLGDTCIFNWRDGSIRNFNVLVVKNA